MSLPGFCRFREVVGTTFFKWNGRYHIKLQSRASDSQKEAIKCQFWGYICKSHLSSYRSFLTDEGLSRQVKEFLGIS